MVKEASQKLLGPDLSLGHPELPPGWVGAGVGEHPLCQHQHKLAQTRRIPLARGWQCKHKSVGLSPFKPASPVSGWALGCLLNPAL